MPGQIIKGVGTTNPIKGGGAIYLEPLFYYDVSYARIPSSFSLPGGLWRFVLSGSGAQSGGSFIGGAAGICVATRTISPSDILLYSGNFTGNPGGSTTLTLPDKTVMTALTGTAPGTSVGVAGGAANGDINLTGVANAAPTYNNIVGTGYGGFSSPGAGAASILIFKVG